MKTPARILISGGIALAIFAVSFGVAKAATHKEDTGVDPAIAVPATVTTSAPVLSPVDVGAITPDVPTGLSPEVGTEQVTFAAGQEDAAATPATPAPSSSTAPAPGADVIAAAAALDSTAGEASDLIAPAADASATPTPAPSPTATSGGDETPASDPCADTASDSCPDGVAATLFGLTLDTNLLAFAQASPPTSAHSDSVAWCPATTLPAGTVRMGAFSTELGTVTINYWPTGSPSAVQHMTPAVAQHNSDGSARYCGHTAVLVSGPYDATVTVQTPDERYSDTRMFHFDSRGNPTDPVMNVLPLGHNWLYVRVMHTAYQSAQIVGLPITSGADVSCSDARGAASLSAPIDGHTSEVTAEELTSHNYNPSFTRSTSAVLYVPEGSTAKICGLTFNGGEPTWESGVPDRVESATVIAPNSWEAVVTVRSITTNRPGHVEINARGALGEACGGTAFGGNDQPASDTATVATVGTQVCALAGQNIQLDVQTWYTKDGGGSGTARRRSVIAGSTCAGVCPEPEPRTYNVFLPGLGNDGCPDSSDGDCALARSTHGAVATVDVTWRQATAGTADSWSISGTADDTVPDVLPTDPRMDTSTFMTAAFAGTDFYNAGATGPIKFDRPVTYTAQAMGDCFTGGATSSTTSGHTSSTLDATGGSTAQLVFTNLCVGTSYSVVLRYTDAHGRGGIAAAPGTPGITPNVVWWGAAFTTPQKYLRVTATTHISFGVIRDASALNPNDSNWGVLDSWLYLDGHGFVPSFRKADGTFCYQNARTATSAPGTIVVPLQNSYTLTQDVNIESDYYYWDSRRADCSFRWYDTWRDPQARNVTAHNLQSGITLAGTFVPPRGSSTVMPFGYSVTFTATLQDSPTG